MQKIKSLLERVVRWDATEYRDSTQSAEQSGWDAMYRLDSIADTCGHYIYRFVRFISPAIEDLYFFARAVFGMIVILPFLLLITIGILMDQLFGYPKKGRYG